MNSESVSLETLIKLLDRAAKTGEAGEFDAGDGRKYRVTVEAIEEEPRWWWWYGGARQWSTVFPNGYEKEVRFCSPGACSVYGTTADRDAKRDALLHAARKAGKP